MSTGLVMDIEDLRRQLPRQFAEEKRPPSELDEISISAFAAAAGIRLATAHHLATTGLLSEHLEATTAQGEAVPALSKRGAMTFRERFILMAEIKAMLDVSNQAAWVRVKRAGLKPVFDASKCGARIYLRSDFETRFWRIVSI